MYVTSEHGVRVLDAAKGKEEALIEAKDSNPTAIGVFPNRTVAETFIQSRVVFGNPRGYFVESWADGKLADTIGTIETSTVAKDAKPADGAAVPLAVDPNGRSAIVTGPLDGEKRFGRGGKNVLWAYVCGNHEKGSPGNRVMVGHTATVVSAAWAKEGGTAVTGDADGRVIVWDAKTMTESRRVDLGGRIMALAISVDGKHTAAYVRGKQGGDVYVWETAKPMKAMKPIHTELADFGSEAHASLTFSPDGKLLAGCAGDKKWLPKPLVAGKVRVWELASFAAGLSDDKDIERLVKQLGSDEFKEREAASNTLNKVGKPSLNALRRAAKDSDDAEVRSRATKLVLAIHDALAWPIDLGPHVNQKLNESFHNYLPGNDLATLPTGKQTFASIKFTVGGGVVQLGAGKPDRVERIKVGVKAEKLQFLHACGHKGGTPLNTPIAKYVVHYADKTKAEVEVAYGKDVVDWWVQPGVADPTRGKVAWEGENKFSRVKLFLTTWANPNPDKRIVALASGVPDATVAALLGHSGTTMLHRHYSHLTSRVSILKEAAGKIRS